MIYDIIIVAYPIVVNLYREYHFLLEQLLKLIKINYC